MEKSITDKLAPEMGSGFVDFQDFGRFTLSRANLVFCKPHNAEKTNQLRYLGFTLVLSGEMHLQYANQNKAITMSAGQVWWRTGYFDAVNIHVPEQKKLQMLSLDFQQELLDALVTDKLIEPRLQSFITPSTVGSWDKMSVNPTVLQKAQQLLHLPSVSNELERIQLEGRALGLLVEILKRNDYESPLHQKEPVEMASIILTNECGKKITIHQLAKRVGINECTLKREFKRHYQMTIGEFVRERRMLLALDLLNDGCQLQQVAEQTGYSSKQYFCQVFNQRFGYLPENL